MTFDEMLDHIYPQEDGCWEWDRGHLASGYGLVRYEGRNQPVHRVVYEEMVHPIPKGKQMDHLCRNRGCCNPDHLEPVTQKVNLLRGESPAARNARKTTCPEGHPYDMVTRGSRECSICKRARRRRHYLKNRVSTRPFYNTGYCQQGHEVSGSNAYVSPQGEKRCRTCRSRYRKEYHERTGR